MPRSRKKLLFFFCDFIAIFPSFYGALALRHGTLWPAQMPPVPVNFLLLTALLGGGLIYALGLHRIKLRGMEGDVTGRIALAAALLFLAASLMGHALRIADPVAVPLMFGVLFFAVAMTARLAGLGLLQRLRRNRARGMPVIIYGAGAAGIQLAATLRRSREARPVLFVDDNADLHGTVIAGLRVQDPARLPDLVRKYRIRRILLAIPSLDPETRGRILMALQALPVDLQVVPSQVDIVLGRCADAPLLPVAADALLSRDRVDLDTPEISRTYAGQVIMVTGAGGSIGSELCRQLRHCAPAKLVLFEQSEYALYTISQELGAAGFPCEVVACLGSVTNRDTVMRAVTDHAVDIILHAAAYKHVPLVECNEIAGAANNVLGTRVVADVARHCGAARFILVSTDKAVRPTSVMGATKRVAELVIQDIQTRTSATRFAMVRFGNVLGSSGSVLPLFEKQLAAGGPLTVTHPEVTRFFMTIPEAARLVLLAGAYAEGGDVFVLDMGKPQRIMDIAKRMIALSGRSLHNELTGEGDIDIEVTGLRPGEKLYEELLIDNTLCPTPHKKIMRAKEIPLSELSVASLLRDLEAAIDAGNVAMLRQIIASRVDGYHVPSDSPATPARRATS